MEEWCPEGIKMLQSLKVTVCVVYSWKLILWVVTVNAVYFFRGPDATMQLWFCFQEDTKALCLFASEVLLRWSNCAG